MKDLIAKLRESPEFQMIMEELSKQRPIIPVWKPGVPEDDWKHHSSMQQGWDKLFQALTGRR